MYILYHSPLSQHSRRVVALIEEAGLWCELRTVDMAAGEHQSEAFKKINPNGQVPALIDGDLTLSESNAILRHLCNKHALSQWYPTDHKARALVEQWLDWNQSRLAQAVVDIVLNKVFLGANGDTGAIARGEARLAAAAPVLEMALSRQPYIAGRDPTIADLSIASNMTQLEFAGAAPTTVAIRRWRERMDSLKGVRRSCEPIRSMMAR